MASVTPPKPSTDAELRQLYPPHLDLQLVQVLMRHGERSPINGRFQNTGLPAFWPYCASARQLRSLVLDPATEKYTTFQWRRRLETFGRDLDAPVVASGPGARGADNTDDVCDMGSLTDLGRRTTFDFGRRLRAHYVDRLGFIPPSIADSRTADSLYLRSTPIPRALESLQQAFSGLYPAYTRNPDLPPPTILTRSPQDETLFPNESNCRRFAALSRAFAQRAADRWNPSPEMAFLNRKIGRWMPPDSPRVAVDSHPRLSGVMDTVNATRAHDRPETLLPREFYDPEVVRTIERIGVDEWYAGYRESNEYRTLGIGGLLGDVVSRMVGSAERSSGATTPAAAAAAAPGVRFGLSGCHDTTLAAVLASLGAFGTDKWPPFTSHIVIEMFRAKEATTAEGAPEKPAQAPASSWLGSLFSSGSAPASAGIGRRPTESLTPAECEKLDGYYVRLRYNDEPVTIPGCKPAGKHLDGDESFCTLEAFKSIVDKFTPTNWKQQCRVDTAAPAFPKKPEPAGYV